MLDARAGAGDQQQECQRREAAGDSERHEAEPRDRSADHQQRALAEPFGEQPGRDLGRGERARVAGLEDAGRGQRQAELGLPDRQQHEDHVREPVVQEVSRAGRGEHRAPTAALIVLD
jgi:hypothetical protein